MCIRDSCCVECGQEEELNGLDERAKLSGASKLYIEDIVDEFCDDYIVPCVQANACLLYTSIEILFLLMLPKILLHPVNPVPGSHFRMPDRQSVPSLSLIHI